MILNSSPVLKLIVMITYSTELNFQLVHDYNFTLGYKMHHLFKGFNIINLQKIISDM